MYRAKQIGRDNFQFYPPEFNQKVHEKFRLQEDLRNAVARKRVRPALSAAGQPAHPRRLRRRSADPLEPSDPRAAPARAIHPACRGDRADRADRRMGAQRGLPAGQGLAGRGPAADPMSVNVSARQFKERNLIGHRRRRLARQRPRGEIPRTGADRKPDHAGRRSGGGDDGGAASGWACSCRSTISAPATRASAR